MGTLFEDLQKEFCPPLDSSLLAALLHEITTDDEGASVNPSDDQIQFLRETLATFANDAEFDQMLFVSEDPSPEESTATTPSLYPGSTDSSDSSLPFDTPLGFLHAALPHIPLDRFSDVESEDDMWDVIAGVLSEEAIREMEERGLEGLSDEEGPEPGEWMPVQSTRKKKKGKGKTIALSDIRQQHHLVKSSADMMSPMEDTDPWTQLTSLSMHIASFLPPHTPSYFLSYFHRPEYPRSYLALRAALAAISPLSAKDYSETMINILDVLLFNYPRTSSLVSDIELCLSACQGRGDDALELVKVLRDLDAEYSEIGLNHAPTPPTSPSCPSPLSVNITKARPILVQDKDPPPSPRASVSRPTPAPNKPPQGNTGQWQKVHPRRTARPPAAPGPSHVPTYVRDVNGRHSTSAISSRMKDTSDMRDLRRKINDHTRRRDEMLREASKMWQKGGGGKGGKGRGGEVAAYFAERAREFQTMARTDSLRLAREIVFSQSKKLKSENTLDLHGTTAAEAVAIVREYLEGASRTPLTLITGRGAHSATPGVSVLKPALRKALVEDGWIVSDGVGGGGLIVKGRR